MADDSQQQIFAGCLKSMRSDDLSSAKDLLNSLKDINMKSKEKFGNDRTLLHIAGATGKIDFVNLLVREKQANVNAKDKFGRTPIFLASRNGFLDCVQALLQNGADKDIEDRKGKKCLHYATEMGEWNIVKALGGKVPAVRIAGLGISKQDQAKAKGRKASMGDLIAIANRRRGTSIAKKSIWRRARSAVHNALQLWEFAKEGNVVMIKISLDNSNTPVDCPHTGVHGFDRTALHLACAYGRVAAAKYLIEEQKADINQQDRDGNTPLHLAAMNNSVLVVNTLLEMKCKPNESNVKGETPLSIALKMEFYDIVFLIREITGIKTGDGTANNEVHVSTKVKTIWDAARYGDLDTLKQNLNAPGVDVNGANEEKFGHKRTLLHIAAASGKTHVVKYLLENGAAVNSSDRFKRTPLFFAARNDEYEILKILLEAGADRAIVDAKGNTACDFAKSQEHFRCSTLLSEKPSGISRSTLEASPKATPSKIQLKNLSESDVEDSQGNTEKLVEQKDDETKEKV